MSEEHSVLHEDTPKEYVGRLPTPDELTRFGGYPGVKYCLVHGTNLGAFRQNGWELTSVDMVGTVKGPQGDCGNIIVMARGKPIHGADPMNGRRQWYVDPSILEETGLDEAQLTPVGGTDASEEEAEAPAQSSA